MNNKEAIRILEYRLNIIKQIRDEGGMKETADENIEALSHAIEVLKASEWQPIETAPKNGSVFYGVGYTQIPCRYKPYSAYSQEYKNGIKGRWQVADEYGGWNNTKEPPKNWIPQPPKEGE
jgi:hypothetical protein